MSACSLRERRLLVMGAGPQQRPLIRRAKELGIRVFAVDGEPEAVGLPLADASSIVDITNIEDCLSMARAWRVEAALTTASDWPLRAIAAINETLGFEGINSAISRICTDKCRLARFCAKAGMAHPKTVCISSLDDPATHQYDIPFPWIVKPADNSGSRGVSKARSSTDFARALAHSLYHSISGRACIQQELKGLEFGAQAIVTGGALKAVFFHNDQVEDFIPIGHSMPCTVSDTFLDQGRSLIEKSVKASNLSRAVMNFDFFLQDDTVWLLEFTARAGGAGLPELIHHAFGFELRDAELCLAFGETPSIVNVDPRPAAARAILPDRSGRIAGIRVPEIWSETPFLLDLGFDKKLGDAVHSGSGIAGRVGSLIATGDSVQDAEQNARLMAESIKLEII